MHRGDIMSVLKWRNGNTWKNMVDLIFPVGSIHLSRTNTSPASFCGGTWADLNEDRFLLPSAEWATGGSTTITVAQIPAHTHDAPNNAMFAAGLDDHRESAPIEWPNLYNVVTLFKSTGSTGGGQAYWQPYRKCWGWYRTA